MKPFFSIITPVLDEASLINDHIAHLQALDGAEGCEIIVVDGEPRGTTIRAITAAGVVTALSEPSRARQMNTGVDHSHGDVLVFVHADTRLPRTALTSIREALHKEQVVGGAFDLAIQSRQPALRLIARVASLRSRATRVPYGDQAIFLRRACFAALGGYGNIPLMEDVDLMRRVKKTGGKIVFISDRVYSSARRWEQEGVVYCTIRNWTLITLYLLGVSPARLAKHYRFGKR